MTGTTGDQGAGTDDAVRRQDGGPRMRASDADRSATVGVLQDAVARGLLSHEEGAERMATAFAARYRDELPLLTADLPPDTPPDTPPVPAATALGWHALGSTLVTQVQHELSASLAAGVRSRRFLATAAVTLLLLGVLMMLGSLAIHGLFDGGGFDHHFDAGPR